MADPRPSGDGMAPFVDRLLAIERRLADIRTPSGTQRVQGVEQIQATVNYLASLKTHGFSGSSPLITGVVANDAVNHWFATSPDTTVGSIDCPTGRMLITASVGEASLTPGGSFVIGLVSFSVKDANGDNIPNAGLAQNTGRLYTDRRMGLGISTGPTLVTVDPALNPGPYQIRGFVGMWVASANTTDCSGVFQSVSLTVQVIGDGV